MFGKRLPERNRVVSYKKQDFFVKMRAPCFACSFPQKRGAVGGWLQVGASHFNEKNLTVIGHYGVSEWTEDFSKEQLYLQSD